MKPLQLQIKGLNSFMEEQLIDFSRLTECGLFGIFGPTGSGKSTILDAITLALYGKVPRAGGQLNGIVNSQSDSVQVAYEFALGSGKERRIYRVQRSFKRNKNSGGEGVSTKSAIVYDISDENEPKVILEGKREVDAGIGTLIGLTAEDFTRSVVLPQGSFSEFLKMTGSDRAQMLERVFALEAYGERMNFRIKQFKGRKNVQRLQLDSLLTAYENCSPEIYADLQEKAAQLRQDIDQTEKNVRQAEMDYQRYKEIWALQEELSSYQEAALVLEAQKESMLIAADIVAKAEKAAQLTPLLEKVEQREQLIQTKTIALTSMKNRQRNLTDELAQILEKWEKARQEKEQEIPIYIEKVHQMETAVKIQSQLRELETEHRALQEQYLAAKNTSDQKKQATEEIKQQLAKINAQLNEQHQVMETLKTAPQLRERINEAYELERQCDQFQLQQQESRQRLIKLEESRQKNRQIMTELNEQLVQEEEKLNYLEQEIKKHAKHSPGQKEDLLALQTELNRLESETVQLGSLWQEEEQARQELAELGEKYAACQQQHRNASELYNRKNALLTEQLRALDEARDQHMAVFLAARLTDNQACPVCGSLHHPRPASGSGHDETAEWEPKKSILEAELSGQQENIRQIEEQLQFLKSRREFIDQLSQIRQGKLAGRNMSSQQNLLDDKKTAFDALKQGIFRWEEIAKANDQNVLFIRDALTQLGKKLAAQQIMLQKDEELFAVQNAAYQETAEILQAVEEKYKAVCLELGLEKAETRVLQMQKDDRALEELGNHNNKLNSEREKLEKTSHYLQEEMIKIDLARAEIETSGKERRQVLDQKRAELQLICKVQNPETELLAVNSRIAEIEKNYLNLQQVYELARQEAERLNQDCASMEGDQRSLEIVLQQESMELAEAIRAAGFSERGEIQACYLEEDLIRQRREEIVQYQDQRKLNLANLRRVNEKLQGQTIAAEAWQQLQDSRSEIQNQLAELNKQLILLEAEQADMQVRLQAKQELLNKKQSLDQEYGLLGDLENLFRGNKFVDFIARTQLSYIAKEASNNLKDITRGRYALEINADGDFVIRDDFNGGVRRATHTLSGGETFLCSLALALALSSHIQLGRASLEFFFLDEGFGSLDPDTLDIVIDSLESLHSETLSVGLISHVEELKQRVPRKLIVSQAVPGVSGSTVTIE